MSDSPASRRSLLGLATAMGLSGCALPVRGPAVPRGRIDEARALEVPNERFNIFDQDGLAAMEREFEAAGSRARREDGLRRGQPLPPVKLLAVSGGGENGAFGAGLLCGWTDAGTRPVFNLVTGVSTGALTAPFAYLGSAYDGPLREVYTDLTLADVARSRGLLQAVFADGLADNSPLFRTISRYMNEAMLAAIARTYGEGRLLLIGTTQLDAQLPIIWNIGAIAASGHPGALDLIRRILLASAAIPGAFPPVMLDVTVAGRHYQEMHVDGGAFTQVFLYPRRLTELRRQRIGRRERVLPARAFIIRNGRLDPDWAEVNRRTLSIAGRAIATMIASSGYNDVVRIWNTTERDGVDFNLAFIGADFTGTYSEPFEPAYMRALYDYAFARARRGFDWAKRPPA